MDDSAITCNEIIDSYNVETKIILINFNEKRDFYVLLAFLLITIASLIAASIYCFLIKYQAKRKHLLPFHFKYSELERNYMLKMLKMRNKVKDIDIKTTHFAFSINIINIKNLI